MLVAPLTVSLLRLPSAVQLLPLSSSLLMRSAPMSSAVAPFAVLLRRTAAHVWLQAVLFLRLCRCRPHMRLRLLRLVWQLGKVLRLLLLYHAGCQVWWQVRH